MIRHLIFVLSSLALLFLVSGSSAHGAGPANQKQEKPPAKEAPASMTGCVDEQEGSYVLLSDRTMNPIANLEADGFPKEEFAKHVGHKVTVRGTSIPRGALPLFKVRAVETVSETCTSQR